MNKIKKEIERKELLVEIDGELKSFEVEILKREKEKKEVYIKLLNNSTNVRVKPFDKVEVKMHQNQEIFLFNSIVLTQKEDLIVIMEPEKIQKVQRRKNKRYTYTPEIEIKKYRGNVFAKCFDFSKNGFGFYCKDFFCVGDILFLDLHCPFQKKIFHLEVTVRNMFIGSDGYIRYGVQFAEWIQNEFDYLLKFLERREKNVELKKNKKQLEKQNKIEEKIIKNKEKNKKRRGLWSFSFS